MMDEEIDEIFDESGFTPSRAVALTRHSPIIFMYPSLIVTVILAFLSAIGARSVENPGYLGLIFLLITFLNLSILSIRYTRSAAWSVLGLGLSVWLFFVSFIDSDSFNLFRSMDLHIFMAPGFYGVWICLLGGLIFADHVQSRMETWRIVGTDLVCYRAIGIDERYPVSGIRIHVETDDVAKYVLLGSGNLYIMDLHGRLLVTLKHVIRIRSKEIKIHRDLARAKDLWSSMQGHVGSQARLEETG